MRCAVPPYACSKIEGKLIDGSADPAQPMEMTSEPANPRARGIHAKLTPKQRRLIAEFEEISALIRMDYWNILDYDEDGRTAILEVMRQQLIRSDIIMAYTLIDEFLSVIMCHYYFKKPKAGFSFKQLWRTKKFQIFANYFLDDTYLLKKMAIVNAIKEIPSPVKSAIARINEVRNAIAHSFFPENRRQYKAYKKVIYRGANIFAKEGVAKFSEDTQCVQDYLIQQAFGVNPADARTEIELG
jgi:hypothetical protein